MIAALFVETNGVYFNHPEIIPYDLERDAKTFNYAEHFMLPVIAHPPCERWGRYWSGGPSAKVKRKLGDDDGCFRFALRAVREHSGVLEHPADSKAWEYFSLRKPPKMGYWVQADSVGWTCHVEQGHYGHKARKATWLYAVNTRRPDLIWGPSSGMRLDEGFHPKEERRMARESGQKPIKRLSRKENVSTPILFRDLLIDIARSAR